MTRLSFNEQGRIVHHRDFWDIKDLMGLCPGVSFMHWIMSRTTAMGLSYAYRLLPKDPTERGTDDLERAFENDVGMQGLTMPNKYGRS